MALWPLSREGLVKKMPFWTLGEIVSGLGCPSLSARSVVCTGCIVGGPRLHCDHGRIPSNVHGVEHMQMDLAQTNHNPTSEPCSHPGRHRGAREPKLAKIA